MYYIFSNVFYTPIYIVIKTTKTNHIFLKLKIHTPHFLKLEP